MKEWITVARSEQIISEATGTVGVMGPPVLHFENTAESVIIVIISCESI